MRSYPILVECWDDKHPADLAVCTRCHREFAWDPSEGGPYVLGVRHQPARCGGWVVRKFEEGVRCRGCGRLDFSMATPDGCCSRACQLQAEYAAQLAGERTNQR